VAGRRGTGKRRTKYTWFPTIGTNVGGPGAPDDNVSGREFIIFATPQTTNVIISPLTVDVPLEGDDIDTTAPGQLAGAVGQEYFIRRVVGKVFAATRIARNTGNDPSTPPAALLGVGLFVARANDSSQGHDTPIGSASASERQENYNPLGEETIREPWIWRRTWVLGNTATREFAIANVWGNVPTSDFAENNFPSSTAGYGSVMDGPHMDAKTARRVGNDERLWIAIAATPLPTVVPFGEDLSISGYFDFRILAQLRRARQRGVF